MKVECDLKLFDTKADNDSCMAASSSDWNSVTDKMKECFSESTQPAEKAVLPISVGTDNKLTVKEVPIAGKEDLQSDLAEALLAYGKEITHTENANVFRVADFPALADQAVWNQEYDKETYKLLYYLNDRNEDGIIPLCILKEIANDKPNLKLLYINTEG